LASSSQVLQEKRLRFLERVAAMLTFRGRGHIDDADVADSVSLALNGVLHEPAAEAVRVVRLVENGSIGRSLAR
jgi:hypothetical protein